MMKLGAIAIAAALLAGRGLAQDVATQVPVATDLPAMPPPLATNVPAGVTNAPAGAGQETNQAPAKTEPSFTADPVVGKVLMALAAHYQSATQFRCEVSFQINSEMEGMRQEISAAYALAVAKPNRFALRHLRGMAGNTVVCNGKTLVAYAALLNKYEEREAPASLQIFSQGVGAMSGNMLFVDNLLTDDIYAAIMEGVLKASYAGRETLGGMDCDHLKFVQDQFEWDLWVTPGPKPLVIQVLSDMSRGLGVTGSEGPLPPGMKMTILNRFSNWVVDGDLPGSVFEFKPPPGARKAGSLFEMDEEEFIDQPAKPVPVAGQTTNQMERK